MKKLLLFLLFPLFLYANNSILIINSYHKGYEFSDKIVNGLEKVLFPYDNSEINTLYMDSKRVTTQEYYASLKQLYSVQLKNQEYDLIIAIDRFAYDFVLSIYDEFFKEELILAVGIENFSFEKAQQYGVEKKVSALLEKRDLKANVQIVKKLMPGIKKLYIINDKSLNALHTEPLILELIDNFDDNYELIYLKEDSLEALNKRFNEYEENSAALFIRFYQNKNGQLNKNHMIAKFIQQAKIPIFITDSIFIKKGAVGGKIVDLFRLGQSAGEMAIDILNKASSQIVISKDLYYAFDAQKLEEFTLPLVALSEEYELVNKRETYYDKHRGFINFVFTISPFLLFLIAGLIHNIYRRKRVEKELRQRIDLDSVLLNAIDSPIFWQDKQNKIIDSNTKFCNLIGVSCQELHGRTLAFFVHNKNAQKVLKILEEYQNHPNETMQFKSVDENYQKKIYLIKQACYMDDKTKTSGTVTIFADITREKEIEKAYMRNQQFIIQQSKLAEIGEVFSSIAHQWKSPLVEITTIAQECFYKSQQNSATNEVEDESFVKDIMTQVDYMNTTINDFQKFVMPSNEKVHFSVKEAIDAVMDIMAHNIKYNYLNVEIKVHKNTKLDIYGFRNEFMQSFLNIINNAKDALIKNDVKNRKIIIELYNKSSLLFIEVQDNAGGIQKSFLHKVFKPYFSTKPNGHGIGLYMSKVIIEDKMNGKILVSNGTHGACFKIILGLDE
jgi:PAS domain S-box-containing protein